MTLRVSDVTGAAIVQLKFRRIQSLDVPRLPFLFGCLRNTFTATAVLMKNRGAGAAEPVAAASTGVKLACSAPNM